MIRKVLIMSATALIVFSLASAFGQDSQSMGKIQLIPRISVAAVSSTGSTGDVTIFRAIHAGAQGLYDLGFIHPGVEIAVEYDAWYQVVALPLNVPLLLSNLSRPVFLH